MGMGIVRLEGEIAAITADEKFKGGDYTEEPQTGINAFGMVWAAWLYSPQWWRDELWRTNAKPGTTFERCGGPVSDAVYSGGGCE